MGQDISILKGRDYIESWYGQRSCSWYQALALAREVVGDAALWQLLEVPHQDRWPGLVRCAGIRLAQALGCVLGRQVSGATPSSVDWAHQVCWGLLIVHSQSGDVNPVMWLVAVAARRHALQEAVLRNDGRSRSNCCALLFAAQKRINN